MKTKFTLLAAMFLAFFSSKAQQVPDGNFENWPTSTYAPAGWATYESCFDAALGLSFRDDVDVIAGDSISVKLLSDTVQGQSSLGIISGVVSLGTGTAPGGNPTFAGIAFTYRPDTLWFDYKYTSPGSDTGILTIGMWNDTSLVFGQQFLLTTTSQWQNTYVLMDQYYLNSSNPDTLIIQFTSSNDAPVIGSTLIVNNVRFGYVNPPTAISEVKTQSTVKVYPNPASDVLNIVSANDISGSNMEIFDITGRLVSSSQLESSFNKLNIGNLANGNYIYKITNTQSEVIGQNKFTVAK